MSVCDWGGSMSPIYLDIFLGNESAGDAAREGEERGGHRLQVHRLHSPLWKDKEQL